MSERKFKPGDIVRLLRDTWFFGKVDSIRLQAGDIFEIVQPSEDPRHRHIIGGEPVYFIFHENAITGYVCFFAEDIELVESVSSGRCSCPTLLLMTTGCRCGGI